MRHLFMSILGVALVSGVAADPAGARKTRNRVEGPVPVRVSKVIDGDTLVVVAQIWIDQRLRTKVRILGIDAPERRSRCPGVRNQARAATKALDALLKERRAVLRDIRYGKFAGRVVARVFTPDGRDVAQALLQAGLVRPYRGRRRLRWC